MYGGLWRQCLRGFAIAHYTVESAVRLHRHFRRRVGHSSQLLAARSRGVRTGITTLRAAISASYWPGNRGKNGRVGVAVTVWVTVLVLVSVLGTVTVVVSVFGTVLVTVAVAGGVAVSVSGTV